MEYQPVDTASLLVKVKGDRMSIGPEELQRNARKYRLPAPAAAAAQQLKVRLLDGVNEEWKYDEDERAANATEARRGAMIKKGKILVYLRATPGGKLLNQTVLELRNPDGSRLPMSKILQKKKAMSMKYRSIPNLWTVYEEDSVTLDAAERKALQVALNSVGRTPAPSVDSEGDNSAPDDESGPAVEGNTATLRGIITAVDSYFIRLAVDGRISLLPSDLDCVLWELTETVEEATLLRQREALTELENEYVFNAEERNVRMIMLGSPDAVHLAAQRPLWATDAWMYRLHKGLQSPAMQEALNTSQRAAIATAAAQTFTLWQGPPGTGKTRTLHALVQLLVMASAADTSVRGTDQDMGKILAVAGTNAAADNLLEGLVKRVRALRVGQPAVVRDDLQRFTLEARVFAHPDQKLVASMEKKAAEMEKRLEDTLGSEDITAVDIIFRKQKQRLKKKENPLAKLNQLKDEISTLKKNIERGVLEQADVIVGTCAAAGQAMLASDRFRMVILDEASQVTEPVSLIALLKGAECIVMAGDPEQLPPTIKSARAQAQDLMLTLFTRLTFNQRLPLLLLDTQYRMHPLIAEWPSLTFYQGLLKTGITPEQRPIPLGFDWPNSNVPVAMLPCTSTRDSTGRDEKGTDGELSSSFRNTAEAQLALKVVKGLVAAGDVGSIAILTPYNAQVRLLTVELRKAGLIPRVAVASVDAYQGREADLIVFSAVRNNPRGQLGFVRDPRRLNVAITRPRRGLIVIGSPATLGRDERWNSWLAWVQKYNAMRKSEN